MNRAERRRQQRTKGKSAAAATPAMRAALRAQAAEHLQAGRLQQAEHGYRQLLEAKPDDAEALNLLGMLAGQRGDYRAASQALRAATRLLPQDAFAWNNLGLALRELEQTDDAIDAFNRALAIEPGLAQVHNNLGSTLRRQGNTDAAMQAYRRALELDHDYTDACFNLGKLYRRSGRLAAAGELLGQLYKQHPDDSEIQRQWVLVLLAQGNYTEAAGEIAASIRALMAENRPFLHDPVARGQMDRNKARLALLALKEILDGASISFFLRSGTLLGCIRTGDFLAHDKDIDLGVFEKPGKDALLQLLLATNRFQQLPDPYPDRNRVSFSMTHTNGTVFDVYLYQDRGDHYLAECYKPGQSISKRFTKFTLAPVAFLGTTFQAPANHALYLRELYGEDWQSPRPFFDSMVSSRNLEPRTEEISKCFAYSRLGGALQRAEPARAENYCQQILEKFPADAIALEVGDYLDKQR